MDQLTRSGPITRIRTFPEDEAALRRPAKHVEAISPEIAAFARDLCAWMRREDGVGLAATQVEAVGMDPAPNLFVMARGPEDLVFVNPVILDTMGTDISEEGCLSFGRVSWTMPAPQSARVDFLDLHGQRHIVLFRGIAARCVTHETDHLKGKLMIDRMLRRDRKRFLARLAKSVDSTRTL